METEKYTNNLYQQFKPFCTFVRDYITINSDLEKMNNKQKEDLNKLLNCIFPTNDEEKNIQLLKLNKNNKFNLKDFNNARIRFPNYKKIKKLYPKKDIKEIVDICIKKCDLPLE